MKRLTTHFLILLLLISSQSFADGNTTQVGRYVTVTNTPAVTAAYPLAQTFHITFPESVNTIGEAMNFLLMNTGYALANPIAQDSTVKALLKKPLPQGDRTLGEMTVATGLLTLAGNVYQLVLDPAHRLVGFRLRPEFNAVYHAQQQRGFKW